MVEPQTKAGSRLCHSSKHSNLVIALGIGTLQFYPFLYFSCVNFYGIKMFFTNFLKKNNYFKVLIFFRSVSGPGRFFEQPHIPNGYNFGKGHGISICEIGRILTYAHSAKCEHVYGNQQTYNILRRVFFCLFVSLQFIKYQFIVCSGSCKSRGEIMSSGQTLGVKAQRFRGHTSPHRNVKEKKR
eukprot:TRINITY_DN1353_c0_g1_i3.p1 TRINITY_DN1353_c0_g1~~TRINITY_DN1353_c0_g1_i3.p1  ORF type:complete len:184 (+),score=8.85 TRINITY_DN1353_c0_g1_i3:1080-1631(+)